MVESNEMVENVVRDTQPNKDSLEQITKLQNDLTELTNAVETLSGEVTTKLGELSDSLDGKIEEAILAKLPPINPPNAPTTPNSNLTEFLSWANKREELQPQDPSFYVYEESYVKALAMVEPLQRYIDARLYPQVLFSLTLHYIITEDYEYRDESGFMLKNPLYKKYNIGSKSFIVSSASDESSSSSIHATKSLNEGDFTMQDLIRTKYGTYVYQILEQLDIGAVLL